MSYRVEPQIIESFRGVRELNGINSGGAISALECKNVELVQSEIGNATGIKTVQGNTLIQLLPNGFSCIELFESVQDGISYTIIYGESENEGRLFYVDITETLQTLVSGLKKTNQAEGLTMSSTAFDVFVFSNGEDVRTVCFTTDSAYASVVQDHNPQQIAGGGYVATIEAVDFLGRSIKFLSMTEWNGFLVVASQYGVHSSHQNNVYKWDDNPENKANSWYIDFGKPTTAVVSFTGGLYIFTQDDVTFLNTTPNDTANSILQTVAMNGCFSHKSFVKHDIYLFFYDNKQKNIFYMQITDTGQTRPAGPVAQEIQSKFNDIERFKMYSCIYNNRNEIWCLINDEILIYDYTQKEWVTRKEQEINSIALIKNVVYSGDNNGCIRAENYGISFDGQKQARYQTTYINIGSNTNMKKQKTPLLITLNTNATNDFYVQLICNGKEKNPKHINIENAIDGKFAQNDAITAPENQTWGTAIWASETKYNKRVVEVSTPQTWYTLSIVFYTQNLGQGFYIQSVELKNIKAKSKTRGR